MSILKVDTINEKTSGNGVAIPGHVIQVVQSKVTNNISTTSSSYSTTGLEVTIAPKFSTSKLRITVLGGRNYYTHLGQYDLKLYVGGVASSAQGRWTSIYNNGSGITSSHYGAWSLVEYVDADNTNSRTYQVYHKNASGTGSAMYFNSSGANDIYVHMFAEEIAQ